MCACTHNALYPPPGGGRVTGRGIPRTTTCLTFSHSHSRLFPFLTPPSPPPPPPPRHPVRRERKNLKLENKNKKRWQAFLQESNPVGVNGFKRRQTLQIGTFGRGKKAPGRVRPSIRLSYPALQCAASPPPTAVARFSPIASVQLAMTAKMRLANNFGPSVLFPPSRTPPSPSVPLPPSVPPTSMSGLVYTPTPHPTLSCPLASDASAAAAAINKRRSERLMLI